MRNKSANKIANDWSLSGHNLAHISLAHQKNWDTLWFSMGQNFRWSFLQSIKKPPKLTNLLGSILFCLVFAHVFPHLPQSFGGSHRHPWICFSESGRTGLDDISTKTSQWKRLHWGTVKLIHWIRTQCEISPDISRMISIVLAKTTSTWCQDMSSVFSPLSLAFLVELLLTVPRWGSHSRAPKTKAGYDQVGLYKSIAFHCHFCCRMRNQGLRLVQMIIQVRQGRRVAALCTVQFAGKKIYHIQMSYTSIYTYVQ